MKKFLLAGRQNIVGFSYHKNSCAVCTSGPFESCKNGQQETQANLIASNSLQWLAIKKSSKVINKGNKKQQIYKTLQCLIQMTASIEVRADEQEEILTSHQPKNPHCKTDVEDTRTGNCLG